MKFSVRIFILLFLLLLSAWYVWDSSRRNGFSFICPNPGDVRIFNKDNTSDIRLHYQKFFRQKRFRFPRNKVSQIILRRNISFVSFLTGQSLPQESRKALQNFLNNPENFDWQENNMLHSQADYILFFYDNNRQLNGKLWLCTTCSSLKAVPFSPNMKFGHIQKDKWPVLKKILRIH